MPTIQSQKKMARTSLHFLRVSKHETAAHRQILKLTSGEGLERPKGEQNKVLDWNLQRKRKTARPTRSWKT